MVEENRETVSGFAALYVGVTERDSHFHAALRTKPSPSFKEDWWRCTHQHTSADAAAKCAYFAREELARGVKPWSVRGLNESD